VTRNREIFRAPRPLHVLLSPALPILGLLSGNSEDLVPGAVIFSLTLAVAVATASWLILARLVGNVRTSALAISVLGAMFLSQTPVTQLARLIHLPQPHLLGPVLAVLSCVLILRFGGAAERWTVFANAVAVAGTLLLAWPTLAGQVQAWRSPTRTLDPIEVLEGDQAPRPDIYILILDGYGRADVLRDYYGFSNELPSELQALGFSVAHGAASNYPQTAQSLTSSLNHEYLQQMVTTPLQRGIRARKRFADLLARNRTFSTLARAGYRIRAYPSEYGLIRPAPVHERPHPWLYLTDFEYGVHEASMFPLLASAIGLSPGTAAAALHRRLVRWTLDHLERELPQPEDPPTLVFAHLLIPHPPFLFEPDGMARESSVSGNLYDGNHWRIMAGDSGEAYEEGYVKAVRYLNSRLIAIVRGVLENPRGREAIIYLQGDHGPGSRLDWNDPERTDLRERLGILLAARIPQSREHLIHSHITPVNAIRVLLNAALGTDLPLIEDRSYFSTWTEPLEFVDVTDRVR
jgi:hypothetical protein